MPGVGLSKEGNAQAERLAASFVARPPAAVVSSPLERARATAAPIAVALQLALAIEPAFDEIDFGAWTGRSFADLESDPEWGSWNRLRSSTRCPEGETMLGAQARAVAGLIALRAAHPDGEVVVVSHQDILKALLCHALGAPLDMLQRLAFDPAHRAILHMSDDWCRVDALNLPPEFVTREG